MYKNGDIIFPISYRKNDLKVLYIEEEPSEKIVYNASAIVLRVDESIVESKYIYTMLRISKNIQKNIEYLCENKSEKQARITAQIINMIYVPKLDKTRRTKVIQEYTELENASKKFKTELNNIEELKDIKFI